MLCCAFDTELSANNHLQAHRRAENRAEREYAHNRQAYGEAGTSRLNEQQPNSFEYSQLKATAQ